VNFRRFPIRSERLSTDSAGGFVNQERSGSDPCFA